MEVGSQKTSFQKDFQNNFRMHLALLSQMNNPVSIAIAIGTKVVNTVPFWLEWPENLVPVYKPKRETPLFHLGKIFGPF
jgi:hypothetical protein